MRFNRRIWVWFFIFAFLVVAIFGFVDAFRKLPIGNYAFLPSFLAGLFFLFVFVIAIVKQPIAVEVNGNKVSLVMLIGNNVELISIRSIDFAAFYDGGSALSIVHSKGTSSFTFTGFSNELLKVLDKIKPIEVNRWPFKTKKLFEGSGKK